MVRPIVESFMREGVVALEVYRNCNIVWCGCGCYLSPEEKLVCVSQFRKSDEAQLKLQSKWQGWYL